MNTSDDSYDFILKEIEQIIKRLSITEKTLSEIISTDEFVKNCCRGEVDTYIDPLPITLKRLGACFSIYGKDEISIKLINNKEYQVEIITNIDEVNNNYILIFWRAVISSGGSLSFPILITRRSSELYVFNLPVATQGKSGFSTISFGELAPLKDVLPQSRDNV